MVDQPAEGVRDPSDGAQSVAGITPDQLNAPQSPNQSNDLLLAQQKYVLANKHTKEAERKTAEAESKAAALEEQIKALTEQIQQTNTASLENQGQYKTLWEEAQKTIAGLKADLQQSDQAKESVAQEFEQERLKVQAMSVINDAGALSPHQMYDLLQVQHGLRKGETGGVEVVVGGASLPLADHLANLRSSADSGYQHHFSASGARGMGAAPTATVAPGMKNPWRRESYNFTEQQVLMAQNPELAAVLQAEAGR